MLIFDELKRNDPQLRLVALMLASGLFVLLVGLWWVQVVSARQYQSQQQIQAYRTVRVPAARGKILDRDGRVLAENAASYNLNLDLGQLRQQFEAAYRQLYHQARLVQLQQIDAAEKKLGRSLSKAERKKFQFTPEQVEAMREQARYSVANAVAVQIGQKMGEPLSLDAADFRRHYATQLVMAYPLREDLNQVEMARFEEHYTNGLAADLDMESERVYPHGPTAGHLLGYVREDDSSIEGEDAFFNYRLPDLRGVIGIEGGFDAELHGHAGEESVTVNNFGFRQAENIWTRPEPGKNVVLTLDLDIQQAAEKSLAAHQGTNARAAIIVMNVRTGDVLAMVSFPQFYPGDFAQGISRERYQQLQLSGAEQNRATQENYAPGSIFKPVVALAALEKGLNPDEIYDVQPDPQQPWHGCIYVGRKKIGDTVPPGHYNLQRAIEQSSNSYFVYNGLRTGIDAIIRMAQKFHFGERAGLPTRQETKGYLPTLTEVHQSDWHEGDSAYICFGQGKLAVTPLQMAVAYSAIANGGTVLWPRLVDRVMPQDSASGQNTMVYPSHVKRDQLDVSAHNLTILREAMLSETEDAAGTGRQAVVGPEMRICGKTGTAQVENEHGHIDKWNYWFASFAPYESPKYAVVVMVQGTFHGSGGSVCAPIAHDIYEELLNKEKTHPNVALN